MATGNWPFPHWVRREWAWWVLETIDRHVAGKLETADVLIALSGSGLHAGRRMKRAGKWFICDRGSAHIRVQNRLLVEEAVRWGVGVHETNLRVIRKEEAEYDLADAITVPSSFAKKTFVEAGVPGDKVHVIPYGADLSRFRQQGEPPSDEFVILYVGQCSLRKGIPDLLNAFKKVRHPRKRLRLVGSVDRQMKRMLRELPTENVEFCGSVPNKLLNRIYSSAHVLVLPSIEDGFGMVMGEAMACGCPVIATQNTGGPDLFDDGKEGYIISIRSPDQMASRLEEFAENEIRSRFGAAAIRKIHSHGGWDSYGGRVEKLLMTMAQTALGG